MIFLKKKTIFFAILNLLLVSLLGGACRKHGAGYNPYLHQKVGENQRQQKENKKVISKASKSYKKQTQKNRKHLFGRKVAP